MREKWKWAFSEAVCNETKGRLFARNRNWVSPYELLSRRESISDRPRPESPLLTRHEPDKMGQQARRRREDLPSRKAGKWTGRPRAFFSRPRFSLFKYSKILGYPAYARVFQPKIWQFYAYTRWRGITSNTITPPPASLFLIPLGSNRDDKSFSKIRGKCKFIEAERARFNERGELNVGGRAKVGKVWWRIAFAFEWKNVKVVGARINLRIVRRHARSEFNSRKEELIKINESLSLSLYSFLYRW